MVSPVLSFSVLVPMVGHLDHGLEAVSSWVHQRYPADRFEILVLSSGAESSLEDRIRRRLRRGDRLLRHPSADARELHDAGARLARGDCLVLTEFHCVADPGFLPEMAAFLADGRYAGACCRTVGSHFNAVGATVRWDFEQAFAGWTRDDDHRKVIIHGFTIRRDVYLAVGGYEPPFGNFMDSLLAAKLAAHGHRLGYAERARVTHHYAPSLADTVEQFASYALGECSYRLRDHQDDWDRRFGAMPEWGEGLDALSGDRRPILQALWRQVPRALRTFDLSLFAAVGRGLWQGYAPPTWSAALAFRTAWLRCHLFRRQPARMRRAFLDLCRATVRLHRLRFLRGHAEALVRRVPPVHALPEGRWAMPDIPPGALFGFYDAEWLANRSFRWSRPIAALRLALGPGRWRVELDTGGLRPAPVPGLRAFWNGVPCALREDVQGVSLELAGAAVDEGAGRCLVLTCRSLRAAPPDTRPLGLPLFAVDIRRT